LLIPEDGDGSSLGSSYTSIAPDMEKDINHKRRKEWKKNKKKLTLALLLHA